jgi:thiamine biosynthesis lipoprotein
MGSPCEILVGTDSASLALGLARPAIAQAWRIEQKFSRYRSDSVIAAIHQARGSVVAIDPETERLIAYAAHCHDISQGLFDITCGILRQAWQFDTHSALPSADAIAACLPHIGFQRVQRGPGQLCLPHGMEIDLGGLAKEYAVDCALDAMQTDLPVLVNFGGDLRCNHAPDHQPWQIGLENPSHPGQAALVLELNRGALATSGDAHRYLEDASGKRYGHILNPHTGWPIEDAPRSVTVAANTCIEAGTLSTLAQLEGAGAEAFLTDMDVRHWVLR